MRGGRGQTFGTVSKGGPLRARAGETDPVRIVVEAGRSVGQEYRGSRPNVLQAEPQGEATRQISSRSEQRGEGRPREGDVPILRGGRGAGRDESEIFLPGGENEVQRSRDTDQDSVEGSSDGGEFEGQQRGRALRQVVDEEETLFEIIVANPFDSLPFGVFSIYTNFIRNDTISSKAGLSQRRAPTAKKKNADPRFLKILFQIYNRKEQSRRVLERIDTDRFRPEFRLSRWVVALRESRCLERYFFFFFFFFFVHPGLCSIRRLESREECASLVARCERKATSRKRFNVFATICFVDFFPLFIVFSVPFLFFFFFVRDSSSSPRACSNERDSTSRNKECVESTDEEEEGEREREREKRGNRRNR